MGVGGISISALRLSQGYEFSLPTYTSGLRLLSRTWEDNDYWFFLRPFKPLLWIAILVTTIVTGIITWIFEDQTFNLKKNPQRSITNLKEMIWQALSGLSFSSEIRLQKFPARILWLCFWFMILILTATYNADMTTKMAAQSPKCKINVIEKLKFL